MESKHSLREEIDRIVVAAESLATVRARWCARYPSDSHSFCRRATKAWIKQTTTYKQARHWGKFRRAVMFAAFALGRPIIVEIERAGLLSPTGLRSQEFATCLRDLAGQLTNGQDDALSHLAQRLRTYRSYEELSSLVEDQG